jgi:tRNA-Thr(GGU) m(6)t(6)A37 methyltransferase TsaA
LNQARKKQSPVLLKPIGTVKNEVKEIGKHGWDQIVSEIIVRADLEDALDGLEEFSHIVIIFWMHLSPPGESTAHKTHPQMRPELPLVGVLATRSPVRPNPVGISVVKLLERRNNILKVIGLDAIDSTPVVDIKPYLPRDAVPQIKVPDWVHKLHNESASK